MDRSEQLRFMKLMDRVEALETDIEVLKIWREQTEQLDPKPGRVALTRAIEEQRELGVRMEEAIRNVQDRIPKEKAPAPEGTGAQLEFDFTDLGEGEG